MRITGLRVLSLVAIALAALPAAAASDLVVQSQAVGPFKANCFLLYDTTTKEAALFDAPGPVDSLTRTVTEKGLNLKYIFITHAHFDHVFGLTTLVETFPGAAICMSREEYDDSERYLKWAETLDPKQVEEVRKNPALVQMMDFDLRSLGKPVVFVKNGDVFRLGDVQIRSFIAPGHSRGSVCYHVDHMLFSGDVLFNRGVGRADLPGSGGWDELVKSVRRLYSSLPGNTVVYPGHGQPTDIGSEKTQNPKISQTSAQPN